MLIFNTLAKMYSYFFLIIMVRLGLVLSYVSLIHLATECSDRQIL